MADNLDKELDNSSKSINISELLLATLHRWHWIVISVLICVSLALFYVLRSQPVYERSASIVINDDDQGNSIGSGLEAFADMGFVQTSSNINDEINHLKSPDVMTEVIRRLDLMMNYYLPGTFHNSVVYGTNQPILVEIPSLLDEDGISMTVDIDADGNYIITDLKNETGDVEFEQQTPTPLDSVTITPVGAVTVKKSAYFRPEEDQTVLVSKSPLSASIAKYSGEFTIARQSEKGNTIDITVTDASQLRGDDLIETLINVYNEKWIENRNLIAIATSKFITERLRSIEQELGDVDQDISSYQSEHLIPDVQAAASMFMEENKEANSQILELNNNLQMTRYLRDFLNDASHRKEILPVNTGIGSPSIENQIQAYNELLLDRSQYDKASASHPHVVTLDNHIADVRAAIIAAVDNQIVGLQTHIKNLQSTKSQTTAQIAANPTQAKYLLSVERQQKVKEALYLFLLQKREENELSQAFIAYNTQIIASPHGSKSPVAPRKMRILGIAFLLGLAIPFGIMFCLETMNTKVRGRKDLETLSAPFIGEIPSLGKKKKDKKEDKAHLVVEQGSRNAINEAFRVLRTNISFMSNQNNGADVIMISSFNTGSGKSFISANLAKSFAIRNKRVLLIDGDLRHATASTFAGSPSKGISDYLIGRNTDIDSLIVRPDSQIPLDVLPVGKIPPNPTELLESDAFPALINALRGKYDYIFIDCPPAVMMADAHIINKVVDRTLFVIRAGLFERSMLGELEKIYQDKQFTNLGIILNATTPEGSGSHYGYRYGYGYGYGYYGQKHGYGYYGSDKE